MERITATVQKIVLAGRHGAYAVALSEGFEGSITFALDETVWHEHGVPQVGTSVVLSKLRKKRGGWRALSGRFAEPSDDTSNQQPERLQQ